MIFADLVAGDHIFLDANTLIYHFSPHPSLGTVCNQLVQRIENGDLLGFTSTHILSEVAHRLMLLEASSLPGWTLAKVKQRLQRQPAVLQSLSRFQTAVDDVLKSRMQVVTIAPGLILAATTVSRQNGLLSNDALIVAIMQAHGLTKLASHDKEFDRVPGITRYGPV
jgi:predicted nucleic acid-binding protein